MLQFFTAKKRSAKVGFTLIELLVVIAIIGVLASIVLASLNTARRKSRDAKRVTDIKQIQLALELFFDANAQYPDPAPVIGTQLAPTYIPTMPDDPLSGAAPNDYVYNPLDASTGGVCADTESCAYYHLGANLEESLATGPLSADADMCPDAAAGCTRTNITGAMNGEDADSCANAAARFCYDVTP